MIGVLISGRWSVVDGWSVGGGFVLRPLKVRKIAVS